ncbi:MAG: hypothetical protein A2048_11025 [Deltaproteobacteria bacterium GWA2_45_12]|nr:MAG: hypothetical protein A2048_11025 [Deltaproteobacteria bacterium GWA2_45_12]
MTFDWEALARGDLNEESEITHRRALLAVPPELRQAADELRTRLGLDAQRGDLRLLAAHDWRRYVPSGLSTDPLISPELLAVRLAQFTPERLSVPWQPGPPYKIPPEVDPVRTQSIMAFGERVNHRVLSDARLRTARVMFGFAPEEDFVREDYVVDGQGRRVLLGDIMGSMTSLANPDGRILRSVSPPYAMAFLNAAIPADRKMSFVVPQTFEEFKQAFDSSFDGQGPEVLLLSGLNVNTRVLLQMNLYARSRGVKEVWLGNYAAAGPYRILDEAFDRCFWGTGEEYLYNRFVSEEVPDYFPHPPAEEMLANVEWLRLNAQDQPERVNFQTLHISLRLGCSQFCSYCAEHMFSHGSRKPYTVDEIKAMIDDAYARGVRRVYFVDPDFGRIWKDENEGEILRYLSSKPQPMKWSCLVSVRALLEHGEEMIQNGLTSVYLGIETLAPVHGDRLDVMNRGWQSQEATKRLLLNLRENGILVFGLYMLGNPNETMAAVQAGVVALAEHLPISQISTNQPFPATQEFSRAIKNGWIFNFDPDDMRYGKMVWAPEGVLLDPDAMAAEYLAAHQQVNDLYRPGGFFDFQRRKVRGQILAEGPVSLTRDVNVQALLGDEEDLVQIGDPVSSAKPVTGPKIHPAGGGARNPKGPVYRAPGGAFHLFGWNKTMSRNPWMPSAVRFR